jgi:mercuric reductase
MIARIHEQAATLPRALGTALASGRARVATATAFLLLAALYALVLPATSTGGAIGLISLQFLTPGELVLALVMALLLALTLALGLYGVRHGAGAKPAGSTLGAVLAILPALLCCSPILPATITAVAAVLPAAGSLGLPLQGFIATHEAWIYGLAIALMAGGLYGSARRVLSCRMPSGMWAEGYVQDWRAVIAQKNQLVAALRQAKYSDLLPSYEAITYIEGRARPAEGGVLVDGNLIRADRIIITAGASPAVPPIPGIDAVPYLTSTTALDLAALPRSLLIIGGGSVGCELGQMFARAGGENMRSCNVRGECERGQMSARAGVAATIVDVLPILSAGEPEIATALKGYFCDEGIIVRDKVATEAIRKTETGVALDISAAGGDEAITAEAVLIATGRRPNTAGLGLAEAGVELLPNGGIKIDEHMRTTRPGVYAAGDVTGRDQFVYMAAYGARIAAENALDGDRRRYDATAMPSVVFTDPQIASVGLTEREARERGLAVTTALLPLDQVPRALAARDTRGLVKLVADADSGKLLGAHILAPEGADSIQTAALAIKCELTVGELAETIFPYLTTVEGLKLAAQSFRKDVAKLSCCAG